MPPNAPPPPLLRQHEPYCAPMCASPPRPREPYFGTKATYPSPPSAASAVRAPPHTSLVHVSLIARHGTRNPTKNGISRMRDLERYLRANAAHLPWLPAWSRTLRSYEAAEGDLTPAGADEMRILGERFRARYAQLVGAAGAQPLLARSSSKRRAVESADAFLAGYKAVKVGHHAPDPDFRVLPVGDDRVVRYTERNTGYIDFSANHKQAVFDMLTSGKATRALQIARRMARTLGVPSMRPELVRVVAEAAAFDCAHGRKSMSPFVDLLEPDDSPFLEAFDRSYRPIIHNFAQFRSIASPLVRDLYATLKAAQAGRAPPADLKFAHSQTLVPFLILLGIDGNGLCKRRGEHVAGLVGMCPFAANFCVELFRSDDGCNFWVRFRLQERYITSIPSLGDHGRDGVVPLERLLDFFQGVLEDEKRQHQLHKHERQELHKAPSLPSAFVVPALMPAVAAHALEQRVFE